MELTPAQKAQYDRDGFLIFPDLFAPSEVAVLRQRSRAWNASRPRKSFANIPAA